MPVLQPSPGPIVLPADLERAVIETLKLWVPFYLAEIDEQQGLDRGTTLPPRFYDAASDNDRRWLEAVPPAVLVVCQGTSQDPERHGDLATYGSWFQVNAAVTAAGATEQGARDLASRLGGALTYVFTQQGDMGELVERTKWLGTRPDTIVDPQRQRSVMGCEVLAECYIRNVVSTTGPYIPKVVPAVPTNPADPISQPDSARVFVTPTLEDQN